jgi:hypothetical protein
MEAVDEALALVDDQHVARALRWAVPRAGASLFDARHFLGRRRFGSVAAWVLSASAKANADKKRRCFS